MRIEKKSENEIKNNKKAEPLTSVWQYGGFSAKIKFSFSIEL